ncbi:voltage-gated ion channel superfamily [Chrysochromulina tobinii]|uniref:Voltage-gated ion channel superfamily n=1 Tax=Chrysochromulina tobinii TaxID=1460289 RepID=A0A0M0K1K7_9EUKA|nr:voltage-gated ion channel superfamily [Chrysochromulina tobinii]|eukprot:KOO32278.1 voltage-gated ion channel superfamily [Chrysochromulina sp. CCMP291]
MRRTEKSPFEAGFVEASLGVDCWVDPWFLANRTLDVIFFVDFVLQFFIVYQGVDDLGDVVWVQDQRKIILRYCGRSFLFDSTSLFIPCYFDIGLAFPDLPPRTPNSGEEGANSQSILRVLRVLRLVKLLRLIRVSKVYKRWLAQMTLSSETITILTCLLLVTIGSHWFACIIGIQTNLHDELQDTWLGADKWGYCRAGDEPCSIAEIGRAQFYIASLTWGMTIITGTGGTDFYPSPTSTGETLVVLVLVLVGALVWTYVLALFCDMTTNANPCGTHFKQLLDGLNIYIQTHQLPRELALRLREYIIWQKEAQMTKFAEKAVPGLSPALQVETVLYVHRNWLNAVWFFKDLEPSCLVRLAREMQVETFAPGEVTPLHNLYVVSRGLVLYAGRVLRRGMVWGTDILLSYEPYFLRHRARAMSYVDVIVLHRDTLMQVTQLFPPSHKILRLTDGQAKATGSNVLYAVRRGLMLAGAPTKDAFGFVTKGAKAEAIYAHLAHTRAVALDCGWRDKQVPQNQIGGDYTAEMQHTELIAVLANLAAEGSISPISPSRKIFVTL